MILMVVFHPPDDLINASEQVEKPRFPEQSFVIIMVIPLEHFLKKIPAMCPQQIMQIMVWVSDPDVAEVDDPGDALTVRIQKDVATL